MKNIKELYIEALEIQDACNLIGLSKRFNEMLLELQAILKTKNNFSSQSLNEHPIVSLWLDKMTSLNTMQFTPNKVSDSYTLAYRVTK